jgi:hypothetical protein
MARADYLCCEECGAKIVYSLDSAAVAYCDTCYDAMRGQIAELEAKNKILKEGTAKSWCTYCTWEPPIEVSLAEVQQHIENCEKHPLHKVLAENKRLKVRILELEQECVRETNRAGRHWQQVLQVQEEVRNALEVLQKALKSEGPHPMFCFAHGGSAACEAVNAKHRFVCPKCETDPQEGGE